jgi:acetyl-CoA synthetase
VALLDPDGRPVADGEPGEIAIRRGDPGMFLGYFEDPDGTAARFRGDYLVTGDLAVRDVRGDLHYRGRTDDLFNTSGYRVGPSEIEMALEGHPAVERAAVVGAPDPDRGAVPKAFVVLRPAIAPSRALGEEIRAHVMARLAAYEYPRQLVFARELPTTTTGKLCRHLLREPGADARYGLSAGDD